MEKSNSLAVLILAAGTSSRLGQPKQLVKYKGKTLIEDTIIKALKLSSNVFVVLGDKADLIIDKIIDYPISIVVNPNFKKGIGSSLSYGISSLKQYEKTLIMLCDQPFIDTEHLNRIVDKSKTTDRICCSFYKGDVAVPAIFPKSFYQELESLDEDKGAKAIIKKNEHTKLILDDNLAFDIDTKEDKEILYSSEKKLP